MGKIEKVVIAFKLLQTHQTFFVMIKHFSFLLFAFVSVFAFAADNTYHYSVDVSHIQNDKVTVTLVIPQLSENNPVFSFPKMVPGTYSIYDFGRFVEGLKAFDSNGKEITTKRDDINSWSFLNPSSVAKITYQINDTYDDTSRANPIFEPAGTNFQADTNVVLNLHSVMGYFRGHLKQPFELTVNHTANFYGSTSLVDLDNSNTSDRFLIPNYNDAVDNPIMYDVPDTAHVHVANTDVLISIYSPGKLATAKGVAAQLDTLLQAQGKYLGGKLPVDKYSFIIYLANHAGLTGGFGALEHSYSSMYYLIDGDNNTLAPTIRDVAAHEFFHIVTPLNIHSYEIQDFDFDNPKMSEHLWLYEGSTEYHAHAVQVKYGLVSPSEYLNTIKEKMTGAQFQFNDSLPFTEMSKGCLDTFKEQYNNVYEKGALISMCLDLELLHHSDGKYGLMNLINDLSKSYGKDKAFRDDELFDKIASLTYPEIKTFFTNYVSGSKPLPYKEVLAYAGVDYNKMVSNKGFSFGQFDLGFNPNSYRMLIAGTTNLNNFGKTMGYQMGDEIVKINGKKVNAKNFRDFVAQWKSKVKEGDKLTIEVLRQSNSGKAHKVKLSHKVFMGDVRKYNLITFIEKPTEAQQKIKDAWLKSN